MKLGTTGFFSNRLFPTEGLGDPRAGWHYVYPVHEVIFFQPAAWQYLWHTSLLDMTLMGSSGHTSAWWHEASGQGGVSTLIAAV